MHKQRKPVARKLRQWSMHNPLRVRLRRSAAEVRGGSQRQQLAAAVSGERQRPEAAVRGSGQRRQSAAAVSGGGQRRRSEAAVGGGSQRQQSAARSPCMMLARSAAACLPARSAAACVLTRSAAASCSCEARLRVCSREARLRVCSREARLRVCSREARLRVCSREARLRVCSREARLRASSRGRHRTPAQHAPRPAGETKRDPRGPAPPAMTRVSECLACARYGDEGLLKRALRRAGRHLPASRAPSADARPVGGRRGLAPKPCSRAPSRARSRRAIGGQPRGT
jgi:hypothetical protein